MANRFSNGGIDLHTHSIKSDGTLRPDELISAAAAKGIKTISLTDHDTMSGVEEAYQIAEERGINLIPGIEISAIYPEGTLHILGYGVRVGDKKLSSKLKEYRNARNHRNSKIIALLQELGIPIEIEEVEALAEKTVGRPHIATVLVRKKVVPDIRTAFNEYLGNNGKAFVPKEIYNVAEAIEMIIEAGGKAFIAHPVTLGMDFEAMSSYIKELKELGLEGIEVYSSSHGYEVTRDFSRIATALDLLVSGGSDFHGDNKDNVKLGFCQSANTRIKEEWISDYFMQKFELRVDAE